MDDTGSVVTVDGRIDPDELGITMTHEHVFIDLVESWFELPDSGYERKLAREPVSLENYWFIRKNQLDNKDNARLESYDDAAREVSHYYRSGGRSLVDVTPKNVGGDPERVRGLSRETGVQIVHGTAYYTEKAHPDRIEGATVEEIADEFASDVEDGIGETDVRAGLIGELGTTGHIHDDEEKVLRAGARAAVRTGASVSVHPTGRSVEAHKNYTYPSSRWGLDIVDILEEEGLPPSRVVMSHMDRSRLEFEPESLDYQRELADRGAYLEYDLWGNEMYHDEFDKKPSDPERVDAVKALVEDGYADRLLFSHDVCLKCQLKKYGGFGYEHVLENIVPMLRHRGVSRETIDTILVENPRRALTFREPA